jgi:predicted amidohydrolase YtcJ
VSGSRAPRAGPGDLLIIGGRVFIAFAPGEPTPVGSDLGPRPAGAPTAVAVRGGRIAWVGHDATALRAWRGPRTTVVDARGGCVMAGFDDAHSHVIDGASALDDLDLFQVPTVTAIQSAIAGLVAARPGDPWVVGHGWIYAAFPGGLPDRHQLDAVVPDRPAFMECYDGHTGWANSAALIAAGIDRDTPDPPDGIVVRDPATGEPTGVLKEGAIDLVTRLLPKPDDETVQANLRRAIAGMQSQGITAVQDAWVEPHEVETWRRLRADGSLRIRARLALPMRPAASLGAWRDTLASYDELVGDLRGDPWLDAGILKGFADGVIEARTASMLEPYVDDRSTGLPEWAPDQLDAFVAAADGAGWQVEIHATGDRGVRMALDAFERARAADRDDRRERRHRVEHVEAIAAADIPRFGRQGVVASMQPFHADPSPNQLVTWAGRIGPERAGRAWAWASIRQHGGVVALGSDWPVVPYDPFLALNSAVNRQTRDGQPPGGWLPGERLGLPEALAAYGHGSAYAAFAEGRRGTVAAGMDADIVVLDRDILAAGPSAIIGTQVALTVVGGEIVHQTEDVG